MKEKMKELITIVRDIIAPVIVWRMLLIVVMIVGGFFLPHFIVHERTYTGTILLRYTAQWDANYYLDIAQKTYTYHPLSVAFFPLYPVLIHGLELLHIPELWAAFWINLVATLGAVYFLYQLGVQFLGEEKKAAKVVWLFLSFPAAIFLAAVYTEALFCFLTFGAFYFASKKHPLCAGIFAALASATRLNGIFVGISIALGYLLEKEYKKAALVMLLAPIGIISFMLYLSVTYHDPIAFLSVHNGAEWSQHPQINVVNTFWNWLGGIWQPLKVGDYRNGIRDLVEVTSWVAGMVLGVLGLKSLPKSWSIFTLSCLILFILSGSSDSINRYILPLFPLYFVLIKYMPKKYYTPYIILSSLALGGCAILFAACYWVG